MVNNYRDTELGSIPTNWKILKLDEFCDFASGGTPSRSNPALFKGSIPWIKSGELKDTYIWDTEEKITETAIKESSAKIFPEETLMLAMYGATVGKTGINKIPAATNQAVCAIFPNEEILSKYFLQYYLIFYRPNILDQRHGGAQPNISQTIIKKILTIVPSLPEQRNISHILLTLQLAIEKQQHVIDTTQALKKSLLNQLFTKGTKSERLKETEIGLMPESWSIVEIGSFLTKTKNRNPNLKPEEIFNYVDVSGISNQSFSITSYSSIKGGNAPSRARKVILEGDILFATVRPTLQRIAVVPKHLNNEICSTGYCVLRPDIKKVLSDYLYYFLQSNIILKKMEEMQKGASYPAVLDSNVKQCLFPLAPLEEQLMISKSLNALSNKIASSLNKKTIYELLFRTLESELMTGQILVSSIDFPSKTITDVK